MTKFSSISSWCMAFWLFVVCSRSEVFAKNVSAFAENISVYFFRGHGDSRDSPSSHIIYCFISLKPASTVFPPNCHSNYRFGVTKSLWESRSMSTLAPSCRKSFPEGSSKYILHQGVILKTFAQRMQVSTLCFDQSRRSNVDLATTSEAPTWSSHHMWENNPPPTSYFQRLTTKCQESWGEIGEMNRFPFFGVLCAPPRPIMDRKRSKSENSYHQFSLDKRLTWRRVKE
jgi:hypothetical protein